MGCGGSAVMDLEPIEERANEFSTWVGKFDSEHRIPAAFASAADVPALLAEVERLRADVAMTARPAPAWDEEAAAEAVRKDLEAAGILPWTNGGARIVRTALAVVRDHLPVKPHRDALAAAIRLRHREMGSGVETVTVGDYESADAVLDLWPGRSEATVKAEVLREAADWLADMDDGRDTGQHRAGRDIIARLRDRADRLAAEGGADRG